MTRVVREAVDVELLAGEFGEAMRELSALGGVDDVFGKMPVETDGEGTGVHSTDSTD